MRKDIILGLCVALCCILAANSEIVIVHPVTSDCSSLNRSSVSASNTTLSEAMENISCGTELHLLPGCHYVESYTLIQDVTDIKMIGEGDRSQVIITCASGLGIAFFNVSKLLIENVTIEGCGLNASHLLDFQHTLLEMVGLFFLVEDDDMVAVLCGHCSNLEMKYSAVVNTTGLGFLGINVIGNTSLTNMEFSRNALEDGVRFQSSQVSGGAIFIYHDYLTEYSFLNPREQIVLIVKQSVFANNYYYGPVTFEELFYQRTGAKHLGIYRVGAGGGLSVVMAQANYSVGFTADSCLFRANAAKYGGGVFIATFANVNDSHVNILDCSFKDNGAEGGIGGLDLDYGLCGGGMALFLGLVNTITEIPTLPVIEHASFIFQRTNFTGNRAFSSAGLYLLSFLSPAMYAKILLQSCSFWDNIGVLDSAILIEGLQQSIDKLLPVQFRDVSVRNNSLFAYVSNSSNIPPAGDSGTVSIHNAHLTIGGNSSFTDNLGSAIQCTCSILELENRVIFRNNVANMGGALYLLLTALVIKNHTHVEFHYNIAVTLGGAIYRDFSSIPHQFYHHYDCFLYFGYLDLLCYLPDWQNGCPDIAKLDAHVEFIGNEAAVGGMVYGSTLESCPWASILRRNYASNSSNLTLFEILYHGNNFSSPFSFSSVPNTTQTVSTLPDRVQIVSGLYNVTPGERFDVSVTVLDRFRRTIPAVLTSRSTQAVVSKNRTHSVLGTNGISFVSGSNGTQTQLTVYGEYNQKNVVIALFASDVQSQLTVNLLNCSSGFTYDNRYRSCICDPLLAGEMIGCDNSTKNLSVPNGKWVGTVPPQGELAAHDCIWDYCEVGAKEVKPPSFDAQCHRGYSRTGVLCGKCIEGYSVVLGTNRCHKCTFVGLAWIIFFGFAGIAIILAISFLQMTISEGYINGVLFYCNIVSLYRPFFNADFPTIQLFIPVAFLNLDLGIETCFYDGMDSLSRAWLQFLFPMYLYILMLLITVLAKYSGRFSRKLAYSGFSPSHLFATLFVMTYTSVLEACAEVMGFVEVKTLSGSSSLRWKMDPSLGYFEGSHIPLAILAILLLLFYVIPAPLLLLFPAVSLKLKFVQQLMPIYDAFWAPFKPRFRFWVGLRLILRAIPFCFAYFLTYPLNVLCLGVFVMILLYFQAILAPFSGTARNAFDIFFMVNLGTLALCTLYNFGYVNAAQGQEQFTLQEHNQKYILFPLTVTVAYVAFLLIFFWHLVLRFPSIRSIVNLKKLRKLRGKPVTLASAETRDYGTVTEDANEGDDEEQESDRLNKLPTVANFSVLREPLLEEGELHLTTREA